jgi:Domain of unknown function (DUF4147)
VSSPPFPLEPFDAAKLPGPEEGDPLHRSAFRAALSGADAYRLTRAAVRRDGDVLRIGNRFVPISRYREIAFFSVGRASISQSLAVTEALGSRLTQGYSVGPDELPTDVPFRYRVLPSQGPGDPAAAEVAAVAEELARELTDRDLLLLLLSPGALGYLAQSPADGPEAWREWLTSIGRAGASAAEVAGIARLTARGPVAGRFSEGVRADVVTLVIDRGDGAALLGAGPTVPPTEEERRAGRAVLERTGQWTALAEGTKAALRPDPSRPVGRPKNVDRPVVVAEPADALRDASESVGEKRWLPRLAELSNPLPPVAAADRFLAKTEEAIRIDGDPSSRGWVVFSPVTLGLLEGVDERVAIGEFLARASQGLPRRDMTVGVARTAGGAPGDPVPPGGVVAATDAGRLPRARAVLLRPGITDVGAMAIAVVPRSPAP